MEPLGDFLKEKRELKRLSIEKVIEDTHILKKFIIGIENDDFTVFPGEAYLRGFLRNYSEYLGLDSNELMRRYEKIKLSETPSPIEQLIPKPGFDFSKIIFTLIILVSISLLGGALFLISTAIKNNSSTTKTVVAKKEKIIKTPVVEEKIILLEENELICELKKDDKVSIKINDEMMNVWLSNLDPTVIMNSSAGQEQFLIGNGYTNKFDINGDGKDDIEIVLNFWDAKSAKLVLRKTVSILVNGSNIDSKFFIDDTVEVLYEGQEKKNIDLNLLITNDTYLRYQLDDNKEVESKFIKGNTLNISATNQVIIWVSNAGAVNVNFSSIGKKFNLGEQGQMDVKIISWTKKGSDNSLQISSLK